MSRFRQTLASIVMIGIVCMVGSGFAGKAVLAADLPISSLEKSTRSPKATGEVSTRLEDFASKTPNKSCTAWTDGCRSCGKTADGVYCSNIGIACQLSEPRCTRY